MLKVLLDLITYEQLVILIFMMIFGMGGAFAKFIVQNCDFSKDPYTIEKQKAKSWDVVAAYIVARILLGAMAGLLIGLVLVDAIKPESGSFFRILFFGALAGYSAPELMKSQEKVIIDILNKHLKNTSDNINDNRCG